MGELDGGEDPGSGSESDLSDLKSELSCLGIELAISSRAKSTEPPLHVPRGPGQPYSTTIFPQHEPVLLSMPSATMLLGPIANSSKSSIFS